MLTEPIHDEEVRHVHEERERSARVHEKVMLHGSGTLSAAAAEAERSFPSVADRVQVPRAPDLRIEEPVRRRPEWHCAV